MALSKISGTTGIADATITSAKLADFTAAVDLNGVELLLDADADTSISADTDDQIDIKIANADHLKILSSSGDTVLKPMVDAKDIIFQQFDGNKVFEINDGNFVGVGGNATAAGQIRIYEDTDNGSHYSGFTVGNLTASVAYQLPDADGSSGQALITDGSGVLSFTTLSANAPSSADGQALGSASLEWSDLFLADGGTIQFGNDQEVTLTHVADTGLLLSATDQLQFGDSGTYIHQSADGVLDLVSDTEIELNATTIDVNGNVEISGTTAQTGVLTANAGVVIDNITIDGTEIDLSSGDLTIDVAGDIVLDADGGDVFVKDAGTTYGSLTNTSGNLIIKSGTTTAATFSGANVTFAGTIGSGAITSTGIVTGTGFTAGSAVLAEAELELLDGLTAGTAIASKVVTTDANIDTTGQRNLTISGELDAATGDFSGAVDVAGATTVVALTASGLVTAGAKIDLNGTELILDADADTSITADTDDQIDVRIAGADDFTFTANDFTALSGSAISTDTINESTSGSGVTIDGVLIKDTTIDVNGTAGALILDTDADTKIQASTDDNIEFFTAGKKQFNLTSSGSVQAFRDGGTTFGPSFNGQHQRGTIASPSIVSSGDRIVEFKSTVHDGTAYLDGPRISFRVDGTPGDDDMPTSIEFQVGANGTASLYAAMTLHNDGSLITNPIAGGVTVFNENSVDSDFRVESNGNANMIFVDGGNNHVCIGTSTDHGGVLNVDGPILMSESDTLLLRITSSGSDVKLQNRVSDKDIRFEGIDGGSDITALHLDMSAGGEATFSNGIITNGGTVINEGAGSGGDFRVEAESGQGQGINDAFLFATDASSGDVHIGKDFTALGGNNDGLLTVAGSFNSKATVITAQASGSYNNTVLSANALRSANNAYSLITGASGNGNDDYGNDLEFRVAGNGNVTCDGSFSGSGADYAEFFETTDGNAIPVGTTVVLVNNKVRAATNSDAQAAVIGVVRPKKDAFNKDNKASMVIGNGAETAWTGKWETDVLGQYVMEEITVTEWVDIVYKKDEDGNDTSDVADRIKRSYVTDKIPDSVTVPDSATVQEYEVNQDGSNHSLKMTRRKENSSYDSSQTYVPRVQRDEWQIIGLLGQVPVKTGQRMGDRWIKMKTLDSTYDEYYIR